MSARFQLRIQRYGWDRAVDYYEDLWGRQVAPAREALLEMAAVEPGQRVVDVACGPGPITFAAARRVGPKGMVLGTDISERMVQQARELARVQELDNVFFRRCDAEAELPGFGSFDTALCSLGLMYAPAPGVALTRMRHALRPGGRVVAAVWGQRARCGWAEIFPIVDARVQSSVCPMFFQLGTGETLARELDSAGFTQIEVRRISTKLRYRSAAQAVDAAFSGGPVALACSRFNEETRSAAEREYLVSLEPYREQEGYALPGEFVVASGTAAQTPDRALRELTRYRFRAPFSAARHEPVAPRALNPVGRQPED